MTPNPECGCMFLKKTKQSKQICKRIIMVLLELGVIEQDPLLFQTSCTKTEIKALLTNQPGRYCQKQSNLQTSHVRIKCKLYLSRYRKGSRPVRRPQCCTSKLPIEDSLVIVLDAKYRCKQNLLNHTFKFHVNDKCLSRKPWYNDVKVMLQSIDTEHATNTDIQETHRLTHYSFFIIL